MQSQLRQVPTCPVAKRCAATRFAGRSSHSCSCRRGGVAASSCSSAAARSIERLQQLLPSPGQAPRTRHCRGCSRRSTSSSSSWWPQPSGFDVPAGFVPGRAGDGCAAFRVNMRVRHGEVDMFGVVKNTIYPEYALHTICSLMEALGYPVEALLASGIAIATTRLDVSFQHPLRPGDHFYCEAKVVELQRSMFCLSEEIVKVPKDANGAVEQVAASCNITYVFLDAARYKPVRMPAAVRAAMQQAFEL